MKSYLLLAMLLNTGDELTIKREFKDLYKRDMRRALHIPCILPTTKISSFGISSLYGYRRHPKYGGTRHHDGIDIAVKNADVVATGSGVVKRAGYLSGYGNFVEIDHCKRIYYTLWTFIFYLCKRGSNCRLNSCNWPVRCYRSSNG